MWSRPAGAADLACVRLSHLAFRGTSKPVPYSSFGVRHRLSCAFVSVRTRGHHEDGRLLHRRVR